MRIDGKFVHRIEIRKVKGKREMRYWGKAGGGTPYIITRRPVKDGNLEQAIRDNLGEPTTPQV